MSKTRAPWWTEAQDIKGRVLYDVMRRAFGRLTWEQVPLSERHNWVCYAEEYETGRASV